ncbi:MAG: DNA repair protein RecN [Bacteroides sp.]|nr:DNA repair protein RecN [Roseburia sp.]MCM1347468.1 DNA repair protein RecN [Bacteroides sp.]MCM1421321.1 DNA repair protein RecN [Bacteroides sp.]
MIKSLYIENYALIEKLNIRLHPGFSVITGETGAGKSIILGAIGLLLGQRADNRAIKHGAKRCVVEAMFDLSAYGFDPFFEQHDLDFDGTECIVRRELTSSGKSRAFINDTPVQLALLKELGEQLIDVHSQHQNLLLNKEDFQINILDILADNKEKLQRYQFYFTEYRKCHKMLCQAIADAEKSREDEDYLRFQANQLAEAELKEGEQKELEDEAEMLSHAEDIKQALFKAHQSIVHESGDDVMQLLKQGMSSLRAISDVCVSAEELAGRLDSCYIEIKDIAAEIDSLSEAVEYNPDRLSLVNERLNTIYALQQKHHVDTVEDLISIQTDLEDRLSAIENSDEHIKELQQQCDKAKEAVIKAAAILTEERKKAAKKVEEYMVRSLAPLGMPNVRFQVEIMPRENALSAGKSNVPATDTPILSGFNAYGADKINFLFSANKSGALQNVAQVASGGEIARVMLSLKALIAGAVKLPTIIFDEIDTGVSGSIAEKMARIMKDMGEQNRQVISITHLPQIAALGKSHYKVYKQDDEDSTTSHIAELTHEQRIEELAHMLSGETLTEAAINNARELLTMVNA